MKKIFIGKGVKRFVSCLVIGIIFSLCLFASWNIGDFVDEFDDPTGDHFLYSTAWGTFNNSVTKKADSPMRVMFYLLGKYFPEAVIRFEPHTYEWDYSVDEFYDDSSATIKMKDELGNVYSFYTENSEYRHLWNTVTGKDAIQIVNIFRNNKTVKIYISIESYTFNYTVDCSNFEMLYQDFKTEFYSQRNKWELFSFSEEGNFFASIVLDSEDKEYGIFLEAWGSPTEGPLPVLFCQLYYGDIESGLFTSLDLKDVVKISFSVGNNTYGYSTDRSFELFGRISSFDFSWDEFYSILGSGEDLMIDIHMTDGEIVTFNTSASEFLKYTKYPYDFI